MVATRARSRAGAPSSTTTTTASSSTSSNKVRAGKGSTNGGAAAAAAAAAASAAEELNPLSHRLWNAACVAVLLAWPVLLLARLRADAFGWERESGSSDARRYLGEQALLAAAGFLGVVEMVRVMGDYCRRKGQTGRDLCKRGTAAGEADIPESQGLAPGIIYMVAIIACQLLYSQTPESLANYNSSLLSICFMLFLGFVDDVLVCTHTYVYACRSGVIVFLQQRRRSPVTRPPKKKHKNAHTGPAVALQAHPPAHRDHAPPLLLQRQHQRNHPQAAAQLALARRLPQVSAICACVRT